MEFENGITSPDIQLPHRIDRENAEAWYERLVQQLARHDTDLRLDLSRISAMDTAGCALLVRLMANARDRGRRIQLTNPSQTARIVLELFRLQEVIPALTTPNPSVPDTAPVGH